MCEKYFPVAFEETKPRLKKLYSPKKYQDVNKFLQTNAKSIPDSDVELVRLTYQWRDYHAKIIDEAPETMFTSQQLIQLVKNPPKTADQLTSLVVQKIGDNQRIPESISTWKECLLNILMHGRAFYDKIMAIKCHNCHETGHAGWGCSKQWSTQATKQNLREDDAARKHQNKRCQSQKRKNKQQARRKAEGAQSGGK